MSDKEKESELVEVLKRSSAIRKDWGLFFGFFLMAQSINAGSGRRPLWWRWWFAGGIAAVWAWLQSRGWLPFLPWSK